MKAILRIFKYCRKRIIELSIKNRQLELQLEYYRAILESEDIESIKWSKKSQNLDTFQLIKRNTTFMRLNG